MTSKTSDQWTKKEVLERLSKQDNPRLHVFLTPGEPEDMEHLPTEIVESVAAKASIKMGGVRKLSRSFWVEGDVDALGRIADDPHVQSVLPAAVDDILPRPVKPKS